MKTPPEKRRWGPFQKTQKAEKAEDHVAKSVPRASGPEKKRNCSRRQRAQRQRGIGRRDGGVDESENLKNEGGKKKGWGGGDEDKDTLP